MRSLGPKRFNCDPGVEMTCAHPYLKGRDIGCKVKLFVLTRVKGIQVADFRR